MTSMTAERAWGIIESTLERELPEVRATLRPPVADAALERLAEAAGRTLPADLVASLRVHDGQDDPSRLLPLCDHWMLLGADEMAADIGMRADALGDDLDSDDYAWMRPERVRTIPNCRGWVRFAEAQAYGLAVDLDPLPAGRAGQVIELPVDGPTPEPVFESYGDWLADLAARLEAGAYLIEDGALVLARARDAGGS